MIDGSEKHNRQLAFELQNSHVCEKRSNLIVFFKAFSLEHANVVTESNALHVLLMRKAFFKKNERKTERITSLIVSV